MKKIKKSECEALIQILIKDIEKIEFPLMFGFMMDYSALLYVQPGQIYSALYKLSVIHRITASFSEMRYVVVGPNSSTLSTVAIS